MNHAFYSIDEFLAYLLDGMQEKDSYDNPYYYVTLCSSVLYYYIVFYCFICSGVKY